MGNFPRTAPSPQSTDALTESMLFRLVRDRKHEESSRLSNVTSSLKFQRRVPPDALWPFLYILHDLSGTAMMMEPVNDRSPLRRKDVPAKNYAGFVAHPPSTAIVGRSGEQAGAYSTYGSVDRISANPFMPGNETLAEQIDSLTNTTDEENGDAFSRDTKSSRDQASLAVSVQLHKSSVEKSLVKDLLLVVQGENGTFLSFSSDEGDEESVKFHLPSGTDISLAARDTVLSVAELGFLFRIIQKRVEEGQSQEQDDEHQAERESGQVSENMYRGVAREMDTHYRSLMTLRSIDSDLPADDDGRQALSLRKVFVWAEREKPRLRWLARLCEETRNLQGGQVLALLRRRRGSYVPDDIRDMISRILANAAAPINRMLVWWLAEGELVDEHGEFYVKEDPKVAATMATTYSGSALIEESRETSGLAGIVNTASLASHRIWWGLFKMRKDMLPVAENAELAQETLIAGKSVAFLRRCCGDSPWVDRVHAPLVAPLTAGDKKLFEADYKFDKDLVR